MEEENSCQVCNLRASTTDTIIHHVHSLANAIHAFMHPTNRV